MREVSTAVTPSANDWVWSKPQVTATAFTEAQVGIGVLCNLTHGIAVLRNWWHDAEGQPVVRNVGEIIALIHSELSEGLEAARKDLPSDHIAGFSGLEEELADAIIRICDFAEAANLRLGEALVAKLHFNLGRPDHDLATRTSGGKQF